MEKLKMKQGLSITLTLFAIFFGAGNMIFPPAMGQLAGTNYIQALAGFILSDAGIAILGMIAVVLVGTEITDLGNLVGKRFSVFLAVCVYLLIGPLFALPRTGSVSFELAIRPYLSEHQVWWVSLIVTGIFFFLTWYLSSNPSKVVDVVGKYLTPVLLICITLIFLACVFLDKSNGTVEFGKIPAPQGAYVDIPFFQGMLEGYNALDGPAGLVFAIIIINAVRGFGIRKEKNIVKYTVLCGIGAGAILAVVYFMLTYVGVVTLTEFKNGGVLLHAVASDLLGVAGGIVLGLAVFFACLTTSIGLTTSFADYFHKLLPKVSYKKLITIVCLFSFVISNVGLDVLIAVSLPVLMIVYPVTIVLVVLSFFKKYIGNKTMVYILAMIFAFIVSFVDGMESAGISMGAVADALSHLPFYQLKLGWVVPAVAGALLGALPFWRKKEE